DGQYRPIAVSIGGQAPTFVATDAEMRPTHPAITWLDQRPGPVAEAMYARLGQPVPIWGSWAAQAAWFTRARPEAGRRTRRFLGCPDYLASRLSQTASFTLFVSPPEAAAGNLDPDLIAPLHVPGQQIGAVHPSASEITGLAAGIPVITGFVDGVLGVLGSGAR